MTLSIDDVAPDRASYRPGDSAIVVVTVTHTGSDIQSYTLVLELLHLHKQIIRIEQSITMTPGTTKQFQISITPPTVVGRGYGIDVALLDGDKQVVVIGSGALDVLDHWSQYPRYGFLSDFAPDQPDVSGRCDSLCRYHLNVVQFYDWMWRHYALLPPSDDFADALGRRLSITTVRVAIAAVQARGGAALAYGAVYAAEPEFADLHPELALFDEESQRISLAGLFYIMNIAPDSPWIPLIIAEFAAAVRVLDFDGIHLDQYGFPKTAYNAGGELVDLSAHFPPLIDAARAAVVAEREEAGVIFNAVGNWPIETVAPTTQDVVYIEVWPPDETYNDLSRLIHEAKRLSGGKPVILAAYLSPFAAVDVHDAGQAEAAALLATAIIAANGGSHLLLGEREGILCDPYYPNYATLRPDFAVHMRHYYDFLVRYEEWLTAPDIDRWNAICALEGAPYSVDAVAGLVWIIPRCKPDYRIVHLINLVDQDDTNWNSLRTPPKTLYNLNLRIRDLPPLLNIYVLDPDSISGRPTLLEASYTDGNMNLTIAELRTWKTVICIVAE